MASNIPKGYVWVRDSDPNAQYDNKTRQIRMNNGRTLMPDTDYKLIDNKAYYKPQEAGQVWTRDLVPNAVWHEDTKTIDLPGLGTLNPNQYNLDNNGRSYINPSVVGKMYMDKANQPLTPETAAQYNAQAEQVFKPLYDKQSDQFGRTIDNLTKTTQAKLDQATANAARAQMNLDAKQKQDAVALRNASIGRGTYRSGVADYEQQQNAAAYAPQNAQLQSELNAQLGLQNAALGGNLANLGAEMGDFNRDYLSQLAAGSMGLYKDQSARDQQAYMNFLNLLKTKDERESNIQDQAIKQAGAEDALFGKITTQGSADQMQTDVGAETIKGAMLKLEQRTVAINNAMTSIKGIGRVTTQEQADLLGVPIGTPSNEAFQAGENRKAEIMMAREQMANQANIAASGNASSERIAAANREESAANRAANNTMTNFSKDMAMWEQTGSAPDTPALRAYGIKPGTSWTGTPTEQINKMKLDVTKKEKEKEDQFNAVVGRTTKIFKVDEDTASVAVSLWSQPNRESAFATFNAQKEALAKQGVNVKEVERLLNAKFPKPAETNGGTGNWWDFLANPQPNPFYSGN